MKKLLLAILLLAEISFAQSLGLGLKINNRWNSNEDVTRYEMEAERYFAAMETQLSDSQKTNINDFVVMLKDSLGIDSLSEKFDVMYLLANETSEAGLKNLVKRSHDATAVNSPTFTQWEGFQGNGTSSYINTNYNPSTQAVNTSLNNAEYFVVTSDSANTLSGNYNPLFGMGTSSSIGLFWFNGNTSWYHQINQSLSGNFPSPIDMGERYLFSNRSASNSITFRGYNTSLDSVLGKTQTDVSTSVENENIVISRAYHISSRYGVSQIKFFTASSVFTLEQRRKVLNCISWYLTEIGTTFK